MKYLIPLILLSLPAYAGPYAEFGISHSFGGTCIQDIDKKTIETSKYTYSFYEGNCSDSPLGSVAIGYTYKGWSVEASHYSSLTEKDKGLNLISIKYRIQ